jgi:hypothetical protein
MKQTGLHRKQIVLGASLGCQFGASIWADRRDVRGDRRQGQTWVGRGGIGSVTNLSDFSIKMDGLAVGNVMPRR